MKILYISLYFINCSFALASQGPNVLILDSSFSPIMLKSGKVTPEKCLVLSESNVALPSEDECYDKSTWNDVGKSDIVNLKGFQDILSGKKSSKEALVWQKISKAHPKQAEQFEINT